MASCITPLTIKHKTTGVSMAVPCSRCFNCRRRRANGWAFRMMKEYENYLTPGLFVTLTYNADHVPITNNGFLTLRKRDVQLFMKRLRFNTGITGIKYYIAGEYGDQYHRPHYHLILYGLPADQHHQIAEAWTDPDTKQPIGQIHLGILNEKTVAYTLKYICKNSRVPAHDRDDRLPQFSLMSKKIGANYLDENSNVRWHHADLLNRAYVTLEGGIKVSMPRYYKEKIYTPYDRKIIANEFLRRQAVEELKLTPEAKINKVEADKLSFRKLDKKDVSPF